MVKYSIPVLALLGVMAAFLGTQNGKLRERIGQLQEECNVRVVDSAREASELARSAEREALQTIIERLKLDAELNKEMADALERRLRERDATLNRLNERLRQAAKEYEGEGSDCVGASVPASIWVQFRSED